MYLVVKPDYAKRRAAVVGGSVIRVEVPTHLAYTDDFIVEDAWVDPKTHDVVLWGQPCAVSLSAGYPSLTEAQAACKEAQCAQLKGGCDGQRPR